MTVSENNVDTELKLKMHEFDVQVHVARAKPRTARYKPLCQRIYRYRKRGNFRVGDMITISLGPLGDDYEDCEYVNMLKEFGDIVDNKLTFNCCVGYISEDGKECLVRWPPGKKRDDGKSAALSSSSSSGQGDIVPSWTCPMKDLAQFVSDGSFGSAHDCRYCLGRRFPGSATALTHATQMLLVLEMLLELNLTQSRHAPRLVDHRTGVGSCSTDIDQKPRIYICTLYVHHDISDEAREKWRGFENK